MRVHQNYVESIPLMLTILLIGGLYLPLITMIVAYLNVGTRALYCIMYVAKGSNARVIGAVAGSLPLYLLGFATFGIAVYQAFENGTQIGF